MSIRLGAFQLSEPFAKGGMGEIWRARHIATQTPVAIKVLTAEGLDEERLVAAIQGEIRASAGLAHPNIIWLYDAGIADRAAEAATSGMIRAGCPWFAMEMANGGTLRERAFSLSWIGIRRVLLDLLDALGHAHARGIIHRDIKPSNVLFMNQGSRIKLTDFGMVYAIESAEVPLAGGTPSFMAPEQFEGDGRIQGPWTDLYSVGCLAWTLVSGHRPYHVTRGGSSALYRLHAIRPVPELKPRLPVPPGLQEWVDRLMAKAPHKRFQRAADAARALIALPTPPAATSGSVPENLALVDSETQRTTLAIAPETGKTRRLAPERAVVHIPADWRTAHKRPGSHLLGAGLGLFGMRELPLIGRDAERDRLWACLQTAHQQQEAQVVILRGPSGYGKSRLAEWVYRRAHAVGAAEVSIANHAPTPSPRDGLPGLLGRAMRAFELDQHELRDNIEQLLPDAPEWATQTLEHLCVPFLRSAPMRSIVAPGSLSQRHAAISRIIRELARGRVAVLFLDDVQFSMATLEWVKWTLERQDVGPALIVLTAQEEALVERFEEDDLLTDLEEQGASRIDVGPLPARAGQDLADGLLALEPALAKQLAERTAGNPLFAVQMVGDWVARGLLDPDGDGGFRLTESTIPLPIAVEAVWDGRIESLLADNPAWEVPITVAAVLGMGVEVNEWSKACRIAGTPKPHSLVLRLMAERLATIDPESGGARWRFAHGMLRETLLDRGRRAGRLTELHSICADVVDADNPEHADRRSTHLVEAGRLEEALDALLIAGRHLRSHDLQRSWDRIREREALLDAMDVQDPERRIEGWIAACRIQSGRHDLDDARSWAHRVLEATDDPTTTANMFTRLANIERNAGNTHEALEYLEGAEALARETGNRNALGSVLNEKASALQQEGDTEGALREVERLLAIEGLPIELEANAHIHVAYGLGALASPREGLEHLVEHEALITGRGRQSMAMYHNLLGELSRMVGDLDTAERAYREALRLAESLGYHFHSITLNLGMVALERDRFSEAEAYFRAVLDEKHVGVLFSTYAALGWMATAAKRRDWRLVNHLQPTIDNAPSTYQRDIYLLLARVARLARDDTQHEIARWALRHAQEQAAQMAIPELDTDVLELERSLEL